MGPVNVDGVNVQQYKSSVQHNRQLNGTDQGEGRGGRRVDNRRPVPLPLSPSSSSSSSTSNSTRLTLTHCMDGGNDEDEEGVLVGTEEGRAEQEIDQSCMFCHAFGGYVVRCPGCKDTTSSSTSSTTSKGCSAVFHPLCAWFQGLHVRTVITDPTFQVPYLHFLFFCHIYFILL